MAGEPRSRSLRALRSFSAVGVLAAAVVAVNVNVLVARFYQRWDLTSDRLYTLSPATERTLRALSAPVEVSVLLGRGDPLLPSLRKLLAGYTAVSSQLKLKFLDPEANPAEFQAIQQKYGVISGKSEDGRVLTDASVVLAQGGRHWFITADELMAFDPNSGSVRPRLEQALTEGVVNVLGQQRAKVCFSKGHQELGLNDAGPEGLLELRTRIEKSNYEAEERTLPGGRTAALEGCRLLIVAGPRLAFSADDAAAIEQRARAGMSVLLLLSPLVGEGGSIVSSGLESLATLADAELGRNLVVETDSNARLPRGLGEIFFATPEAHVVTAGLVKGEGKLELRVLLSGAQSVRATGPGAKALLVSSEAALTLTDVRSLSEGKLDAALASAGRGKQVLGVARELPTPADGSQAARLVLVGAANVAHNRNFRDSGLYGDRILIENAVSWLAARPALVSVPEKPPRELGISLSEESLAEVLRYVLIYMPGSAALLGAFVLLRRRAVEKRSRRDASEEPKRPAPKADEATGAKPSSDEDDEART